MSSSESTAPLLRPRHDSLSPTSLSTLLTRATSRRGPSVLVRQTAARQLELRRAEWGYSAPVVALDVTWNLAFVFASLAVMAWSLNEDPCVPVRVWIGGYALQCVVHVVIVCAEYRRRTESRGRREGDDVANRENESEEEEEANSSRSRHVFLSSLLTRTTSRRGPSVLVRQTAARQLELRRAEWGYSAPVVALDVTWNLAFVFASLAVMAWSWNEEPCVPVRIWIGGYALQCVVHVVIVCAEYRRRTESRGRREGDDVANRENESEEEEEANSSRSSFVKRCESINTMVSFLWWIVGFYWVVSGGDVLLQSAPRLYWLAVVFLAFDVFFAIFCVVLACLIGIALCCCLPCIIAILYAVAGQEGASDADLSILPKYKFYLSSNEEKTVVGGGRMVPVETSSAYLANERVLLPEDAECCICLTAYEDGAELHALPCSHHFHSSCIVKWLKMNATCPLCKYDILKGSEQV